MTQANFNATKAVYDDISHIIERAAAFKPDLNRMAATMDLLAAHNSCPLKLDELALADDANFTHDVFGIFREIDRETGDLGCFLPRFAK